MKWLRTPLLLQLTHDHSSVLENHHAASTFKIIHDEKSNVLETLSDKEYKDVRRYIITVILATDMSSHFELLAKLKANIVKESKVTGESKINVRMKVETEEDRELLM